MADYNSIHTGTTVDSSVSFTSSLTATVTEINNLAGGTPTFNTITVTSSSILGLVGSGTWNGSTIQVSYGGTGQTTPNAAFNALAPSQTGNSGKFLTTDGTDTSWGDIASHAVETFTSVTTVTVSHNFGAYPVVQVFNGSGEVLIPFKITHLSLNQVKIDFASSSTGTVVLTYGNPSTSFSAVTSVSTEYTVTTSVDTIRCSGSNSFDVTLPTAVGFSGRVYRIKNMATKTITLKTTSLQTIDGLTSIGIKEGSIGGYPSITLQSDNVNWIII